MVFSDAWSVRLTGENDFGAMSMNAAATSAANGTPGDVDAVCAVVACCLGIAPEQLAAETNLLEDLGIDSIDRLALAVEFEEQFDVVIRDDALHRLRTIGDIIPCVMGALEVRQTVEEATAMSQAIDEK